VADPAKEEIALANAGHLPPVLLRRNGAVTLFPLPDGLLLGAGRAERLTATVPFRPGDAILAYTDGMVERRDEDIDIGLKRLGEACTTLHGAPGSLVLGDLVGRVSDHVRDDDVAALFLRRVTDTTP
jgi:serine phosphatase RsbU (regulator of sigma subunit)